MDPIAALRAFLARDDILALAPRRSYSEGGCGLLALALLDWLGLPDDALVGAVPEGEETLDVPEISHVVLEVAPGAYLDADGIWDEERVLSICERSADSAPFVLVYLTAEQVREVLIAPPTRVERLVAALDASLDRDALRAALTA